MPQPPVPAPTVHPAPPAAPRRTPADDAAPPVAPNAEDGSLVTEYGLLAVVAATIAGVVIQWASSGTLVNLFNALISRARDIVGA